MPGTAPAKKPALSRKEAKAPAGISPLQEQIRNRAYEIYMQRGSAAASPVEDWLRAEREILQIQQPSSLSTE
jgi:hypothetical protein